MSINHTIWMRHLLHDVRRDKRIIFTYLGGLAHSAKTIIIVASLISLLVPMILLSSIFIELTNGNSVYGQGGTYINQSTVKVMGGKANSTKSFCHQGDALIIGGFSIGNSGSPHSLSHTFVYTNQPIKEPIPPTPNETSLASKAPIGAPNVFNASNVSNASKVVAARSSAATTQQGDIAARPAAIKSEGWIVGAENNSTQPININSTALCLNLHR